MQLKVLTGTLNAQKYQDEILESGVRSPMDSLDGLNMVLRDDIAWPHCTRIIEEYKNQQNIASLPRQSLLLDLNHNEHVESQAWLTCFTPGSSRIKTIVNFTRLCWISGPGFHVLNACTKWFNDEMLLFNSVNAMHSINRK